MKNIKRKLKIISGIIIIFFIALFIYLSQKKVSINTSSPITITGSVPTNGSSKVSVFDPITITFNQKIDPKNIIVTSDPSEDWTISQDVSNSIKINHGLYLRVATTYKLTIVQNNNTVVGTLNFETAQEQNDPRQLQNLQSQLNKSYPLASLTPYETSDYKVVYSAPLTLQINIKSSIEKQEAISEVQAWVKSNGVEPLTHKYIVINSSPTP